MWQRAREAQGSFLALFKGVLTSIRDTGGVLTLPTHVPSFGRRANARALAPALPRPGWKSAGSIALLCSGVAWASLPRVTGVSTDEQHQWRGLPLPPPPGRGGAPPGLGPPPP